MKLSRCIWTHHTTVKRYVAFSESVTEVCFCAKRNLYCVDFTVHVCPHVCMHAFPVSFTLHMLLECTRTCHHSCVKLYDFQELSCCLQPQLFLGFHDRTVANSEHFLFPMRMCVGSVSTHLCACAKIKGIDMMGKGCCFCPMHLKAVLMINGLSCCTEKSADISIMEFSLLAPKL